MVLPSYDTSAPAGPRLLVDAGVIAQNIQAFADRVSGGLMAVVKADGYGAGAELLARTALRHGVEWLGVTSIAEALALREAGTRARILSWLNPVDAPFAAALETGIELAVPGTGHLDAVVAAARLTGVRARIHLQIDCGLAREGASPQQWPRLCERALAAQRRGDVLVVGIMGHLSSAEAPRDPANRRERARFAWAVRRARRAGLRPEHRHLAATGAALWDRSAHHTLCRVGAGLVGIVPQPQPGICSPFTLTAPVIDVRRVPSGTPVGYLHGWIAPADTQLALVGIGYADGLPRRISAAELLLHGRRHPVVGRVSMDQIVVDIGDAPVRLGERATVFGPGHAGEPTLAEWAAWAETIPHELITGIGSRVARVQLAEQAGARSATDALAASA